MNLGNKERPTVQLLLVFKHIFFKSHLYITHLQVDVISSIDHYHLGMLGVIVNDFTATGMQARLLFILR